VLPAGRWPQNNFGPLNVRQIILDTGSDFIVSGSGVHCASMQVRQYGAMTNDARLEIRLPRLARERLHELAAESGATVPGLVRLAVSRLLEERAVPQPQSRQEAAA
jgi:hypothetical protein